MVELASYLAIGVAVGFFAGLLGIGGASIIVSSLALMFAAHGYPAAHVMQLAIGTSLGAIVVGSLSSLRTHDRHGAVDWAVVKAMTPGLLAGVLTGAGLARFAGGAFLKYFFLAFAGLVTLQMALDVKPKASRQLPGPAGLVASGFGIGIVSGLFGGGAAGIGVPYLTWCNMSTHRAIGSAAAMGFPLAVAGSVAYVAAGWNVPGLPRGSFGFVYLPALVGISATSMLLAPVGARLAHRLNALTLRRIFALFMVAVGVKLAISV